MNETFMKEKPIFPLLLGMGMPMVLSMLVNSLYNIVDSYFVARISENAMEALSLVFPIQNFINAMAIGFGVGINALIACLCGLAVVTLTGYWWFILVGIACLVAGWCYVGGKHPYGYHYLGEIFVFIFFGLVATCGTMFALAGTISTEGMLGGANVGLIAVAVLCVNNLRDVETDRTHGKHTWMTALGRRNGTVFAIALLSVAVLLLAAYILLLSTPAMPTIAILAVTCAMCAAAAVAIARKKYGEALPLCTFSSLALAATYVCCVVFA